MPHVVDAARALGSGHVRSPIPRLSRRTWQIVVLVTLTVVVAWLTRGVAQRISNASLLPADRFRDFFEFLEAARALTEGQDIYAVGHLGYIYPPLLAFVLTPLSSLPIETAAWIWSGLHIALLGVSVYLISLEVLRRLEQPADLTTVAAISLLALLICLDKVRTEINMQQCNTIVLLAFALGLVWLDRRPLLSGLVFGFAANIKYLTLITLPYLVLRRRWQAAASLLVSTIGWALLPAVYLGWARNLDYLSQAMRGLQNLAGNPALTEHAARVMPPWFGWSIPAFVARLGGGGHTPLTIGLVALIAVVFASLCWILFQRAGVPTLIGRGGSSETRKPLRGIVAIEWAGLVITALAFGPQTNSPHLSMLLLPCVVALAVLRLPDRGQPGTALVGGLVLLAAGLSLPPGGVHHTANLVAAWRSIAGPTWCALVMYLTMLVVAIPRMSAYSRDPGFAVDIPIQTGASNSVRTFPH